MTVMKTIKYFIITIIALSLISCETRKDIFHQFNSAPEVYLNTTARDFSEKLKKVDILLRHGCQQSVYYDYTDDYTASGIKVEYAVLTENAQSSYITCAMDQESRKVVIKDTLPPTAVNEKVIKYTVKIIVSDYYGDKGEAIINIADYDNLPPEPVITISHIQKMEYKIDASASVDKESDEIVAYEYLIDGETTITESGYEDLSQHTCLQNPGMAGKKGTYIVSTPLSYVKHAFQTTGTHTVSVRVKDSLGLWSAWKSTSVDVP